MKIYDNPEARASYPDNVLHAAQASAPRAAVSDNMPGPRLRQNKKILFSGTPSQRRAVAAMHAQRSVLELAVDTTSTTSTTTEPAVATGANLVATGGQVVATGENAVATGAGAPMHHARHHGYPYSPEGNQQQPAAAPVATSSVVDTFDLTHTAVAGGGLLEPPTDGASHDGRVDFLHQQLDCIGTETDVLNGLVLLGGGTHERLQGGTWASSSGSPTDREIASIRDSFLGLA